MTAEAKTLHSVFSNFAFQIMAYSYDKNKGSRESLHMQRHVCYFEKKINKITLCGTSNYVMISLKETDDKFFRISI